MRINPYIGHTFQLLGVEEYTLHNGKKEGMRVLHVKNGLGLEMCIVLDRGGDISSLTLNGKNLSYLTPNGYVSNKYYDNKGAGWIKNFTAGFLTSCGFDNVGTPSVDEDGEHPLHGSINQIPVEAYSYEIVDDKCIDIRLITLDEGIFARKLRRERHIIVSLEKNEFDIKDQILNRGDAEIPVLVLYHFNMGYPLLKEDSIVRVCAESVEPRDDHAATNIKNCLKMEQPQKGYQEMCYYHKMIKGLAGIYSPSSNIGVVLSYDKDSLKCFTEWKMMGYRDYVLGLEPGNVNPDGYTINKKKGLLTYLKPEEQLNYSVHINCVSSLEEFDKLIK